MKYPPIIFDEIVEAWKHHESFRTSEHAFGRERIPIENPMKYLEMYTESDEPLSNREAVKLLLSLREYYSDKQDAVDALNYLIGNAPRIKFIKVYDGSYRSNRIWCTDDNIHFEDDGARMSWIDWIKISKKNMAKSIQRKYQCINIQDSRFDYDGETMDDWDDKYYEE